MKMKICSARLMFPTIATQFNEVGFPSFTNEEGKIIDIGSEPGEAYTDDQQRGIQYLYCRA